MVRQPLPQTTCTFKEMFLTFLPSPFPVTNKRLQTQQSSRKPICKRPRHATACSINPNNRQQNDGDSDEDDSDDSHLSRRVFLAGVTTTAIATAAVGYRFVIGEDLESRIFYLISRRFPSLFPKEQSGEDRRRPLNLRFAQVYYQAVEHVLDRNFIIAPSLLHEKEQVIQQRAKPLFFPNDPVEPSLSNPSWFNFILYSRLHAIEDCTSPKSRLSFVKAFSQQTISHLNTKPLRQTAEAARLNSELWLANIRDLLDELVDLGWISGFRIDDFDGGPGSSWQDERRSMLSIFAFDPVTMQAAQLIAEEQYEAISPKISAWICTFLESSSINVSFEDYYLDDAYRPDPLQFKPSQFATQFDISC